MGAQGPSSQGASIGAVGRTEIGQALAAGARSILGRSCIVASLSMIVDGTFREIGCSGNRSMRPRVGLPTIRDQAMTADGVVVQPLGWSAGFLVGAVVGRVLGRPLVYLETVAPSDAFDAHRTDLAGVAAAAAFAIDHPAVDAFEAPVTMFPDTDAVALAELTPREREVLTLLTEGATSERIAVSLGITRNTVRTHIQNLRAKLGVSSRLEAAAFALRSASAPPIDRDVSA